MKSKSFIKGNLLKAMVLTGLCSLGGCQEVAHHLDSGSLSVTKPWRKDVEVSKDYVSQIRAIQHIELRAFEKGYLEKTYVDEGQQIKKGEKLFQIMPTLLKAEYEKSKAEYDITHIEYDQTFKLAKKNVVSANELALTKARLEKKKADLDIASAHLKFATIVAPFDGIMGRFNVRLGSLVEEGELLSTLSDIRKLWVYFNVSESNYLNYMEKKKTTKDPGIVTLMLANGRPFDQIGHIDTIESDFDNKTGNVAFRASFMNPDGILRHGETGNIVLKETIQNALVIPQKATYEVLSKRFVYVVDSKGVVQPREIEIEQEIPHLFVVRSGLTDQDTILIEGLGKVNKGQTIKMKFQETTSVMKSLELAAN